MSGGGSDAHTELKIGRILALARRERGLSLKEVEEATKIRAGYLAELERENFDVLPTVYVQGSLRTYANFLRLDGEALVRELKRRQAAVEEPRDPAPAEPQENDPSDRRAALLGGAAGAVSRDPVEGREEPGSRPPPASIYGYLALGLAVFAVLAFAAAVLVSALAWEEEPAISKVREPLIAQAPEASPAGNDAPQTRREDAQSPDDEGDGPEDDGSRPADDPAAGDREKTASATQAGRALAAGPARGRAAPRSARTAPETASAPAARGAVTAAPVERSSSPSPAATAPAPRSGAAQGTNTGGPVRVTAAPGGDFEVRIEVGGDDPVRITGHPTRGR